MGFAEREGHASLISSRLPCRIWPPGFHPIGKYLTSMKRPKTSTGRINPMSLALLFTNLVLITPTVLRLRFRSRGACVVMGGPHVTLLPEEAGRHADVIFVGEAEGLWDEFLNGFVTGTYRRVYRQAGPTSLEGVPMARKTLFHRNDFTSGVLFATRGCPNRCDFCSIVVMYQHRFRKRPIAEVAAEYGSFHGKRIIFWDDNIAADKEYAKQLFHAIAPYRKWWSSQATIHAGGDDELLDAAARSGCKQLFFGLE